MQLHELIETSETISKGGIFDPLFVRYHEVVERQQSLHAVDQEVPVAGNAAHRVAEKRQVHDLRQGNQRLNVTPVAYVVIVEVQEL